MIGYQNKTSAKKTKRIAVSIRARGLLFKSTFYKVLEIFFQIKSR